MTGTWPRHNRRRPVPQLPIVDLFAGVGGMDLGARSLGLSTVGIEWWEPACRSRQAIGLETICADVEHYPTGAFAGTVEGLIASPPCPDWSKAGKRAGVNGRSGFLVAQVLRWAVEVRPSWIVAEQVDTVLPVWQAYAQVLGRLGYRCWVGLLDAADYGVPQNRVRAFLLAHAGGQPYPPEPTHAANPAPDLWDRTMLPHVTMAAALGWGAGHVNTGRTWKPGGSREDSQTRSFDRPALTFTAESETQWRVHTHPPGHTGAERAEASERLFTGNNSRVLRGRRGDASAPYSRSVDRPSPTLVTNTDRWRLRSGVHRSQGGQRSVPRSIDRPAPTLAFGHAEADWAWIPEGLGTIGPDHPAAAWTAGRPATAITTLDRVFRPGHHRNADDPPGPGRSDGAVAITLAEALILQGFDPDLPVFGNKRECFTQVGNAVPPPLAAAVIAAVRSAGPAVLPPRCDRPWASLAPDLSLMADRG